jgi:hypothetical protein
VVYQKIKQHLLICNFLFALEKLDMNQRDNEFVLLNKGHIILEALELTKDLRLNGRG